jgi:dTDP-4-amino-4,6-dideoxygalactose transaminase
MAAILLNLQSGDEVIVPSYTFVSTALAFYMHGAKPVFADIRPDTLNLDESKIEGLITDRTRAIVPVHYAGVGCEMGVIMSIAEKYGLVVIEDNAHGLYGKYKGKYLGTYGHMATQSFHETKNITCGEGGALIINDDEYFERAEIIRDKGTDRSKYFRGHVDKYTWVDKGSSYVMSDLLASFLCAQLEQSENIQEGRKKIWNVYNDELSKWAENNGIGLPNVPDHCDQAYHMYYLLMPDLDSRTRYISYLKSSRINAVFHYQPLHLSSMGKEISRNVECEVTEDVSDRVVRLPFFNGMSDDEIRRVIEETKNFVIG